MGGVSRTRDPLSTAIMLGLVRASPILLLGGLYLMMRESLVARFGALDWFAPPVFLITAALVVARTVVRRRHILPSRTSVAGDDSADAPSDFDADAAIQRYLANRSEPKPTEVAAANPLPPRRGFGRKPAA